MNKKKESKWYFWLAIIVIVFVLLPYLYGYVIQTDNMRFSGSFIGVDDQNSYLAKMRRGYEGDWMFITPYSTFPQTGVFMYMPFILLGKLAGGNSIIEQMHFLLLLMRIASIILYIYSLKTFFSSFLKDEKNIKFSMIIGIFGGGLGTLSIFGYESLWNHRLPLEFYSPEAFSFLAMLTLPHIIIARAFLLLAISTWLGKKSVSINNRKFRYEIVTGIYGMFIFLFQPITFLILLLFILLDMLLKMATSLIKLNWNIFKTVKENKLSITSVLLLFTALSPIIFYNANLLFLNPFVKAWGKQNILTTPPPGDYFLAYSPIFILIIIGIVKSKHKYRELMVFGLWIILSFILIYLPLSIQRRFIEGTWIFLVLFAAIGLQTIEKAQIKTIALRVAYTIMLLPSLFLFTGSVLQIQSKPEHIFVNQSKLDVYGFIEKTFINGDILFADHEISNEIPVWSSMKTIVGQGPESIDEKKYLKIYEDVLNEKEDESSIYAMFYEQQVRGYIIENKAVDIFSECDKIFQNDTYTVCRVVQNE
ncbi:MAG: hypothetical protein JEZ00_08845 [Anaerolineaceae bacterium]|nr:hypothetical protein [Anaerolineaceae bacterium]